MKEIEFIESFGKLELRDGDILVLKTEQHLSPSTYSSLKEQVLAIAKPLNVKAIVLDGGLDIGILRKENI